MTTMAQLYNGLNGCGGGGKRWNSSRGAAQQYNNNNNSGSIAATTDERDNGISTVPSSSPPIANANNSRQHHPIRFVSPPSFHLLLPPTPHNHRHLLAAAITCCLLPCPVPFIITRFTPNSFLRIVHVLPCPPFPFPSSRCFCCCFHPFCHSSRHWRNHRNLILLQFRQNNGNTLICIRIDGGGWRQRKKEK